VKREEEEEEGKGEGEVRLTVRYGKDKKKLPNRGWSGLIGLVENWRSERANKGGLR
jgi:hypothetical protein